jgi:putative tryptophan/tyrosine transport system substrate-binding protein
MRRRELFAGVGSVVAASLWPLCARPQQLANVKRVGFLRVGQPPKSFVEGFRQGLHGQGLIEGQNIVIEWGLSPSVVQLPHTLAELVRLKVDVVVASGTSAVLLGAAGTIPVVFVAAVDPVAMGLVTSLARPGGKVTGIAALAEELNGKRLELLQLLIPNFSSVAFLVRGGSPATAEHIELAGRAARALGVHLHVVAASDHSELEKAISGAQGAGALLVVDDTVFTTQRKQIAEFALKNRLPMMYGHREMVRAGGLVAYGPDYGDLYRRAAEQVHKILKGTMPSILPVEQPTKFELVINLKTANALGLTIPSTLLARADEVID